MPWNAVDHPCFLCTSDRSGLYKVSGLSAVSFPHRLLTLADYRQRVARCQVWKTLSAREVLQVQGCLEFDRRDRGPHGRALKVDVCGLSKGDRVEPHAGFPDVGLPLPVGVPVLFWRSSEERGVKHSNPLFDDATGIDPTTTIVIDPLHCLSLGVFQSFLAALVAEMIWRSNVWGVAGAEEAKRYAAVRPLSAELFRWYGAESAAGRHHTRVQSLDPGLFGKADKPKCKLHCAETNGMLEFSVRLVRMHAGKLANAEDWGAAAAGLVRLKNMIKEYVGRWPPSAIQDTGLVRSPVKTKQQFVYECFDVPSQIVTRSSP
jgi:hypothetical protein